MNHRMLCLAVAAALALPLAGCVGVAAVGVGAAVLSVEDRRTTEAQIGDEGIELRASNRISERFGDKAHINVTSFNRNVLITGEAPNEQLRAEIEKTVAMVPNVRGVTNDVQIGANTPYSSRANDAGITGKVKARFLDANRFSPVHVKVVTENGVVYLLGIVTDAEANAAVDVARTTSGVRKVVKVFEYCKPTDAVCAPRSAKPEEKKK